MKSRAPGGGAAAVGGLDYQHRVGAWVAVHILAEKDIMPPWDFPAGTTLEWLRCETEQPVDDLLVGTSNDGLVFAQIKRKLHFSGNPDSDLASALDQFVRQFIHCQSRTSGKRPWDRPLDPLRDRLMLITGPESPTRIRVYFPSLLSRLQNLVPGQSLNDAALNKEEREVLSVIKGHIERSWQKALGTKHSDDELRQLLSMVRVQILDVDGEGTDERQVMNLLGTSVLQNPNQAKTAWAQLITLCADFAKEQSGADRHLLQQELLKVGLELKAPRSYRSDIERLKEYSEKTLKNLAYLAQIRAGSTVIKIHRQCTAALRNSAENNSILVVGEPGAGKSGALYDFVNAIKQEGRDYVFLAIDRSAARSLGELRAEMGLEHEVTQVLENWPGQQPAFLVIDALDAARGDPAQKMIHDLIREVAGKNSRWRVVASIRKFDLRYGTEIQELFRGEPPTEFQDPEFKSIRHLNIPPLSEEELRQVSSQAPELHTLISGAPTELQDLLRVPFNLRLLSELLGAGINSGDLLPIRTQLDLLDRYWGNRVIRQDGYGDAREAVLLKACEKMVESRMLSVDRFKVVETDSSPHKNDLLSNQVLIEWQPGPTARPERSTLSFSHHVLFDYAAARLLFRGAPENFIDRLVKDPELVIVVRPSLLFHFRYLWSCDDDRKQFWGLVFRVIETEGIPEIGKLIGPSVAAELARGMSDLEPLCAALKDSKIETQKTAEQALRHLIRALLAGIPEAKPLLGPEAGPWCDFLECISQKLREPLAYPVSWLLMAMCEKPEVFTPEQRVLAGQTARRLLDFAWSSMPRDRWLVVHALQCVCRTFESDPVASANLIRRCLEPSHLSQYDFEEMPWLAREIKQLIPIDPLLVEEIYRVAFKHQVLSKEPTPLVQSFILPLRSNRQQDYQMALYELAEAFPEFLEHFPEKATRALIAVMEAYVDQNYPTGAKEVPEEIFDFDGQQARFCTDQSHFWDEGKIYRHDEPLKMLDAFQQYLEKLAERKDSQEKLRLLVQVIVSENRLAVFWRRLLLAGARFPNSLGKEILPLAWAMPVLKNYDTVHPAGEFLKSIFSILSTSQRHRIEQAILAIPESFPADRREKGERLRNRLLGCLADTELVTDEARGLLQALRLSNAVPPNEPPFQLVEATWGPSNGEEEFLREQGVPVEAEPNRKIRELERPVTEFLNKYKDSVPKAEEVKALLPALQALHDALSCADAEGVHPKQRDYAWRSLAAACNCITQIGGLSCNDPVGAFIKAVLLEASFYAEPIPDSKYDPQFEEHPSWVSSPRTEAAKGLILLARNSSCATHDVLEAIERLSNDPVPAVRLQVAESLNGLYKTARGLMWRIIECMCREEPSRGVLQGLVGGPLIHLAPVEPERVAHLAKLIFNRVNEGEGSKQVRQFCVNLFTDLFIWRDLTLCQEIIMNIAGNPTANSDEVNYIVLRLREALTQGKGNAQDSQKDSIRRRAWDLMNYVLHSACEGLRRIESDYTGINFNDWPPQEQESAGSLVQLIDSIGSEIYFASGAYDSKRSGPAEGTPPTNPELERFYREAGPILDELADVGLPSVAHHLLETLEFFVPVDPCNVFLRIGRVVRGGEQRGYQYESLAADLIVKLVERYLAEYRPLLRQNEECRKTLIEILDIFVKAGWPSAHRLTYRLEEIFR